MEISSQHFILVSLFGAFIIFTAIASAQCIVPADTTDCDNAINITEMNSHISKWYKCSACVPDLFNAIQAYYGIAFCGNADCNGTENCTTCAIDCGACPPAFCVNVTGCSDYNITNCTEPDPCDVSLFGCEWNASASACQFIPGTCDGGGIDAPETPPTDPPPSDEDTDAKYITTTNALIKRGAVALYTIGNCDDAAAEMDVRVKTLLSSYGAEARREIAGQVQ